MKFTDVDALLSLRPTSQWSKLGDKITWLDGSNTQPSQSELDAEKVRLENEYNAKEYQRKRADDYPSIKDQLDLIYHLGLDAWTAKVKETKDKYPKP
tara:strand:- start:687 stop:977 length:291 start_codon:yes stop_codon:yes gene_type:complete